VLLDYTGYIVEGYAGIPDVIWEDEDYRALIVTAGADVPEHGRWRKPEFDHLVAKSFEELTAPLGSAPPFPRSGADEDLSKIAHADILSCTLLLSKTSQAKALTSCPAKTTLVSRSRSPARCLCGAPRRFF
jgi:hypothetical protein